MAYSIKTEAFEGPFDLLLHLVSRKKVDIGDISINEITDQYLEEIKRMQSLDLEVASDFLLVAATLLEIKARSLVPHERDDLEEEIAEFEPDVAQMILVERLVTYKQYKNASDELNRRFEDEAHLHVRAFGPPKEFLGAMPDFLKDISLDKLGAIAAAALARRELFLLESEHIAAEPIPVVRYTKKLTNILKERGRARFSELVSADATPEIFVVSFLAVLELYKMHQIDIIQQRAFGDIDITYLGAQDDRDAK